MNWILTLQRNLSNMALYTVSKITLLHNILHRKSLSDVVGLKFKKNLILYSNFKSPISHRVQSLGLYVLLLYLEGKTIDSKM